MKCNSVRPGARAGYNARHEGSKPWMVRAQSGANWASGTAVGRGGPYRLGNDLEADFPLSSLLHLFVQPSFVFCPHVQPRVGSLIPVQTREKLSRRVEPGMAFELAVTHCSTISTEARRYGCGLGPAWLLLLQAPLFSSCSKPLFSPPAPSPSFLLLGSFLLHYPPGLQSLLPSSHPPLPMLFPRRENAPSGGELCQVYGQSVLCFCSPWPSFSCMSWAYLVLPVRLGLIWFSCVSSYYPLLSCVLKVLFCLDSLSDIVCPCAMCIPACHVLPCLKIELCVFGNSPAFSAFFATFWCLFMFI